MPRRLRLRRPPSLAVASAALMTILIVAGGLIWFRPFLATKREAIAEVPAPAGLFGLHQFLLSPHGQACMTSVTVTPDSQEVSFGLRPARPLPKGGPPVEFTLTAPGYRSSLRVPGGYPGGSVSLPIAPPRRALIATACFSNLGHTGTLLTGTIEPRTVSRSPLTVNSRPVSGDVSLTFLQTHPSSLLSRLGQVFGHASNLTDGLVPTALIWIVAVLAAIGVPALTIVAFYQALRENGDAPA